MVTLQRINNNLSLSAPRTVIVSGVSFTRVLARMGNNIYITERNSKTGKARNIAFDNMEEAGNAYNAG